jgi:Flp pilus assembly protein TadG
MGTKQSRGRRRQEKGSAIVLVVIFVAVLFGFAAFSIDLSRVYQQERDMQSATDAAALSAVVLLTNAPPSETSVIQEALTIAQANGVSAGEVAASNIGTIQVGTWDTNALVFTANTPQSQWNAVQVPAKRSVPMLFAQVLGMSQMTPHVDSVAMEAGLESVVGLIPFGVTTNELQGLQYGDVITVDTSSPGNWGKIDLCGINMSSNPNFNQYMLTGVPCETSVGDTPDSGPGFAGVINAFDARMAANPTVVVAVVDSFGDGKKPVNIEGFIVGQLLAESGNGSGWSGQIQLLDQFAGNSVGGPTNAPYAQVRVLVK